MTIEDILFRIDKSIEEHERDIEKKKNESGDNYGMSIFIRTLSIEQYKGMIYAYENLKNAILKDKD
jgi:putative lipoic acid-binding regulatory protein